MYLLKFLHFNTEAISAVFTNPDVILHLAKLIFLLWTFQPRYLEQQTFEKSLDHFIFSPLIPLQSILRTLILLSHIGHL